MRGLQNCPQDERVRRDRGTCQFGPYGRSGCHRGRPAKPECKRCVGARADCTGDGPLVALTEQANPLATGVPAGYVGLASGSAAQRRVGLTLAGKVTGLGSETVLRNQPCVYRGSPLRDEQETSANGARSQHVDIVCRVTSPRGA